MVKRSIGMKSKKEIAILFFIIAVLVFYITSRKDEKTHYKLPEVANIATGDITKISIKKKGMETVLAREGDKWLVGDKKYPADAKLIETMLKDITGLTLTALASESKNYAVYGLDGKNRIEVTAYKGDSLLRRLNIGKPASSYRFTFVMLDDDPRVFHAEGNIKSGFDKTVSELRDKKVMAFTDDITEVTLKKGKEEIKFLRTTAPVSVDAAGEKEGKVQQPKESISAWTTAGGRAARAREINSIVNTLSGLTCEGFIEDRKKEDFKSPVFTVILKGINTYTISIFDKKDGQYPAVSSTSKYPFLISEWKANKIMKDFGSLIEVKKSE